MHLDARKIKELFRGYPNVRLCISGHMHMVDRFVYNDVTYICDGAVCEAWWKGKQYEFDEGYDHLHQICDRSLDMLRQFLSGTAQCLSQCLNVLTLTLQ